MKPSEIKVGRTYRNKGAGKTTRTVLEIHTDLTPQRCVDLNVEWSGLNERPYDSVVVFEQRGKRRSLYIRSFASWAGREVRCE